MDLGTLLIKIRAPLDALNSDLDAAKGKAKTSGGQIGDAVSTGVDDKLAAVGSKLTKTLTPIAGTVAVFATGISQSWNNAQRTMQATTGATGEKLDSLMSSVKNVTGTVKGGMGAISETMATLAAKTGLTGPPLEHLTQQVMGLKELGIQVTAADVGGAFGRWALPTDQWAAALERVFKVAQATGVQVPVLLGRLSEFQPVLQGLGFSFDQASLLVGRLSDPALAGLKKGLDAIIKTGTTDVPGAFKAMTDAIVGAKTPTEGMALAIADFGAKAGPELYSAITKGKFGVEELTAKVDANHGSIMKVVEANQTWLDKLGLLKDKVAADIGPVANQLALVATIASGIGPALEVAGKAAKFVKGIGAAADVAAVSEGLLATANTAEGATAGVAAAPTIALAAGIWAIAWPVLAVVAAVALLVGGFFILTKVFGVDAPTAIGILLLAVAPMIAIPVLIIANWDTLTGFFGDLLGGIGGFFATCWHGVQEGAKKAFDWVIDKATGFVDFVTGIPGKIAGALGDLFGPLIGAAKDALHWLGQVKDKIASLPGDIGGGLLSGVTGGLLHFAGGGVVPGPIGQPQLAVVHGGEQVSTPEQMESAVGLDAGERLSGGGGGGDTYNFYGTVASDRELTDRLTKAQAQGRRRGQLAA